MSLTYIAKEGDIFEVRYKSYYGVIGAIFLILVLWVSVVVNFNLTGLILTTIGSPLLFYVASLFSEKFTLNLNSKQKEGIVILCKGLLNIKQTRYQFSINEIKELVIETMLNTKRLVLITTLYSIPLTNSFDNTERFAVLAEEIEIWAKDHGYQITVRNESVTYKI